MKTVLIINNFFSPTTHVASFRMEAFAKYFHKASYNVYVITEGKSNYQDEWNGCHVTYIKDTSFTNIVFKSSDSSILHLVKALASRIFGYIFLDRKFVWKKKALLASLDFISKHRVDIILSSYGYLSSHLVALEIKRKYPNIKWIADMRDEMSYNPYLCKFVTKRLIGLEKKFLNNSDLITTVSSNILNQYKLNCNHDRFLEILNGYDSKLVKEVEFQERFTISFIGNFHGTVRPDNFFKALSNLKSRGDIPLNFIFKIVGNKKYLHIPDTIKDNILQIPQVPHDIAIKESIKSDVLLIILPDDGRKGVYTGKLFDYLSVNRTILALVDVNDVIAQLLNTTQSGFAVAPNDHLGIENSIKRCYDLWINKHVINKNWDLINIYSREYQVNKLLNYISNKGW